MPRILLGGIWVLAWHQAACAAALEKLGCEVCKVSWKDYFFQHEQMTRNSWWTGLQYRFMVGPLVHKLNQDLLNAAQQFQPEIVWLHQGQHVFPKTIRQLRQMLPQATFIQYANDDPFSPLAASYRWRYLKKAIPEFDVHFAFRPANLQDFYQHGARRVELLLPYYVPEMHYPVPVEEAEFASEVAFVGHYEPDGRLEMLDRLKKYEVKIFGSGWPIAVSMALGKDYRKAISGAKIALCFLSTLNQDVYTRRNFEIPAMQTFMLSQYSDELAAMFKEGVEAEFFRTQDELRDKVDYYLKHDQLREKIALQGYERVKQDGHDVISRMRYLLDCVHDIRN